MLASAIHAHRSVNTLKAIWLTLPLLFALPAAAAVTLDATSEVAEPAGTTSFTFPHVLGTGGNRLVVCTVAMSYPAGTITQFIPTVTFGNVPMTAVAQSPGSGQNAPRVEGVMFWANDNSGPVGSKLSNLSGSTNVSVTVSNANVAIVAGCSSYFGVSQTGTIPESFGVSYSGTSVVAAAIPLTVSGPGDVVVDSLVGGFTAGSTAKTDNPSAPQIALYPSALYPTAPSTYGVFGGSSYQIVTSGTTISPSWFAPATNSPSRSTYSAIAFAAAPSTNYTVTTAVSPSGSGTVTLSPSGGSYASGSSVQFTANPAVGYVFSSFSGDLVSTSNPASLTINGNKSVTANFTPTLCTLSTNVVGTGSITLSPTASGNAYVCGTQVQVTAVPGSGYSFGNFSGALTGSTNPQTLTVNASTSVTATFTAGTSCTLSTSTTGSGTITVSPAGTVFSCGTSLTITAVPAQYYSLTGFSGAITGTTNPQTYVINANSSIAAAFTQTSFPINTTIVGPGIVTANPADTGTGYAPGTQVALTATPAAGASFTGFSGDLRGLLIPRLLPSTPPRM